ncbi:MAG: hypothetical protein LBG95_09395 [Treponema sp.]|jgi:hypothetical protein|nr:hypothetical protein [Treponema sp.]
MNKKCVFFFLLCAVLALASSCLGASADIVMRADGSGKITLVYRVSQMLESLGRLDGNEDWPAIPVGRADFERSLARIPGLRLASYSAKETRNASGSGDLVTKAVAEFKNTAALLAFLDRTGSRAALVQENGKNTLRLILLDSPPPIADRDLLSLIKEISAGYEISFSLSAPKNASLSVQPSSVPSARIVQQGKKVSFAIGLGELLTLENGLVIEMEWDKN